MKVTQNRKRVTQGAEKKARAAQTVSTQEPEAVYEVVMNPGKRAVRDGSDILSEVTFRTISLSCLPSVIYQYMDDFGLNQKRLSKEQERDLIFRSGSLAKLLMLTASTIETTMEQLEQIDPFLPDEGAEE